jgi:hypothetical protein
MRAIIQRSDAEPGSQGPSTLPPPPFQSEAEVLGLEWWLGAHMNLASSLLWLEQQWGGHVEPPSSHRTEVHTETMRTLVAQAAAVRDALYELYCDAADGRLAPMVSSGGVLGTHVRATYKWCERTVALVSGIGSSLREAEGPDWTAAKTSYRETVALYPGSGWAARKAADSLGVDFSSPVEPLRGFPQHLDQLLAAVDELHDSLTKRFA